MSWVRLDDLLPHHRKLVACGTQAPMVLGWYTASIAFANRHFTDGVILPADLPLLLPSSRLRPVVIEQLVSVKFWDVRPEGGWMIHDFLEHNNSAEYRRAKLQADSERKRNGFRGESKRTPDVEPSLVEPSLVEPSRATPRKSRAEAPNKSAHDTPAFPIPESISKALSRTPVLARAPRLHAPTFWQAQIRAHPEVDFPAELLKAEAWITANPSKAPKKDFPRFLHTWFQSTAERMATA